MSEEPIEVTKEIIEHDFGRYGHLLDLETHDAKELMDFYKNLVDIGIFPRSYSSSSVELLRAARVLHKHLCTLDKSYYTATQEVKLREFANAYAKTQNGLRQLE